MTNNNCELETKTNNDDDYSIFRHSLLRYLGYANEIGESFRHQFPKFVVPSYALAFGYCFADATTTGWKAYQNSRNDASYNDHSKDLKHAALASLDVMLWQSLASVMIPGGIINLIVRTARFSVQRSPMVLPVVAAKWLPTTAGLGSIPFIIHPIDFSVDYLLDNTTRLYLKEKEEAKQETLP